MNNIHLVKPSGKYENSFKSYALSYKEINDEHYFNKYKPALEDFNGYILILDNLSHGIDLSEGEVPVSNLWLIDGDTVVGVVRIRHREDGAAGHIGYDISPKFRKMGYGTELLRLALQEASKLGINDAILTCATTNAASRRIIEKNGGILLGTIFDEEDQEYMYKYSIKTSI